MERSHTVDDYIAEQPEWQQMNLRLFRDVISELNVRIEEDIKWSVPVFIVEGKVLFAMSTFKAHTKYNFFNGASLKNQRLFNNGLDSKKSRGIDLREGETLDSKELHSMVNEAINIQVGE
jgi:hypothetical protein